MKIHVYRLIDRQMEITIDIEYMYNRYVDRYIQIGRYIQIDVIGRQMDGYLDGQIDRPIDRLIDRQTDQNVDGQNVDK